MASVRSLAVVPAWRWWVGFVLIVGIGGALTVVAYLEGLPPQFDGDVDKVMHFSIAGLLAFFLDGALRRRTAFSAGSVAVPLSALAVLVPSGIEEYLQRYATLRTSSIWDFAADVAGVIVFIPLSRRSAK
jgi:VanZ family protein